MTWVYFSGKVQVHPKTGKGVFNRKSTGTPCLKNRVYFSGKVQVQGGCTFPTPKGVKVQVHPDRSQVPNRLAEAAGRDKGQSGPRAGK